MRIERQGAVFYLMTSWSSASSIDLNSPLLPPGVLQAVTTLRENLSLRSVPVLLAEVSYAPPEPGASGSPTYRRELCMVYGPPPRRR